MDMTHTFDTDHATQYGMAEAVLIRNLAFWVTKNRANGRHLHPDPDDGVERTWTYNTVSAFAELFPYLSEKQVRRALKNLQEKGVIRVGNFNRSSMDRTLWYAFTDESAHLPKRANATAPPVEIDLPSGENGFAHEGTAVPDGKPDSKPDGDARTGDGHDSLPELAVSPPNGPSLSDVQTRAKMAGVDPAAAERFFYHYDAVGWKTGGEHPRPISNWVSQLMRWSLDEPRYAKRSGGRAARDEADRTGTVRDLRSEML